MDLHGIAAIIAAATPFLVWIIQHFSMRRERLRGERLANDGRELANNAQRIENTWNMIRLKRVSAPPEIDAPEKPT